MTKTIDQSKDDLVPDPVVQREFGVTNMTLYRWTRDPALGFPPPIKIHKRNYRSRRLLETFKQRLLREAVAKGESTAEYRGRR
jgi:hypothetical protein